MSAMYIDSTRDKNFAKFDNYCVCLDEMIEHTPEMTNRRTRAQFSAHARDVLYKIWNLAHGIDIDEFCDGGHPSPLDGGC
jgi:hypothetical protein